MLVYRQTNITHLLSCTRESAFPVPPFPVKMQNMYIRPGYRLRPPDYIMYKETDLRKRLFAYFSIGKLLQEIHKEETYQHQNNGL